MGVSVTEIFKSITAKAKEEAVNIARSLNPQHPTFIVVLQSRSVEKYSMVSFLIPKIVVCIILHSSLYFLSNKKIVMQYVPVKFARMHLTEGTKSAQLEAPDGRVWTVKLSWNERAKVDMKTGLQEFLMENDLKIGDMCLFELITGGANIYLKVHFICDATI